MKHSLKIKNTLFRSGFFALCQRIQSRRSVAILRYHAIVEPDNNYYASQAICITPEQFEAQVSYLSANYHVISLDTVADCRQNNKPFPEKAIAFTFDDGYKDNYLAYQILKKYNATGTFYITAGCIESRETLWLFETIYLVKTTSKNKLKFQTTNGEFTYLLNSEAERELAVRKIVQFIKSNNRDVRENTRAQLREQTADVPDFEAKASKVMLTWQQIREMNDNGMTIGGHTMTHLNLPNALADDAMNEIENCKALLQEKTGSSVHHFSYPNGGPYAYYNPDIKNMVKKAGYKSATTSNNGPVALQDDLFELSRIRVTENLAEILYQIHCEDALNQLFKR